MGIFRQSRALAVLREDLRSAMDRINDLETANKRLSLEWEELYDKVRHQMSRMSKRYADASPPDPGNGEIVPENDAVPGMDPISARIHARRGIGRINQ